MRIEAAGVCHSDLHYMTGDLAARLPVVVGHEGSGIVEALGPAAGGRLAVGRAGRPHLAPALRRMRRVRRRQPRALPLRPRVRDHERPLRRHDPAAPRAAAERIHHLMGVSCFAEQVVVSETSVARYPTACRRRSPRSPRAPS